jgi:Domain of unknown function (DUF4266)
MKKIAMILCILGILKFTSCKSVGPMDRQYLSDSEMQLSIKKCEKMELNFMLYREGSSGANGGKSGGGCGCN